MIKDVKKRVINSLKDKFEIIDVKKKQTEEGFEVIGNFIFKGSYGNFVYVIDGEKAEMDNITYEDKTYEGGVIDEVWNWIEEHLDWDTVIKVDGKEI